MGRSAARGEGTRGWRCRQLLTRSSLRPPVMLGAVLLVILASAGAAATAPASPAPTPERSAAGAVTVETSGNAAAVVFAENCSGCHGRRGEGGFGPTLAPAGFASLVAPMVAEGGIQMPAFADSLTAQQIKGVAEFVAAGIADPATHEADAAVGGEVYRLYCAGCHSTTGRGGALTRGRNAPDLAQYPAAEALAAMILGRGNMPAFADNTLDVRRQAAVGLYVKVLVDPPSPGGHGLGYLGPVAEGAVSAAALLILIFLAVWLAWKSRAAAP